MDRNMQNDKTRISVIIPCYNVSGYIERCLRSVTEQSIGIENIEIICVDDASTDDTVDKLCSWEEKYPDNIMVVRSGTNARQGAARNIGLGYASAEWVAFVDSDDWIEPDYLERLYEKADIEALDMVCCETVRDFHKDLYYFTESERKKAGSRIKEEGILIIENDLQRKDLIHYNKISFSAYSKIIRKRFLTENKIFFPEGLAYEDIFWGSLLNYYVKKAYMIEKVLYHYFINPDSTVLSKRGMYHVDMLTVNSLLWRTVIERGFWTDYSDEIEYEFFYSCILAFVKIIVLRFEEPPYELYRLLCVFAADHVPELCNNRYFQSKEFPELHRLILEGVYMGLDRENFTKWAENIKKIGL